MDKQLRSKIKHDKFVEEVGHTVEYLTDHKKAVKKYGSVVGGALVLAAVVYGFMGYQATQRQADLRKASAVLDAFVGDQSPTGGLAFKTQAEKDAAAMKAFQDVANRHSGSKEGNLARFNTGTLLCDQGKVPEAIAAFKEVVTNGDANASSLAKLSLATIYQSQGKLTEAEALVRDLLSKPTPVVSKEQAQIMLARIIMKSKPQEAKVILESLQVLDRPAVTRAAVSIMGESMSGGGVPPVR